MLSITKQTEGTTLNVALEGRIDSSSVEDFNRDVRDVVSGYDKVVIDMKELISLTSAGLRSLLTICKEMRSKGGMILKNVRPSIIEIFEFTGFDTLFTIE